LEVRLARPGRQDLPQLVLVVAIIAPLAATGSASRIY
jgi:hypothetical protein